MYGFLIINSNFTAEAGTPNDFIYLGRAWDESQNDLPTYLTNVGLGIYPNGQATIRESTLGVHIRLVAPWAESTISRPYSSVAGTYPANRLWEYANSGPGAAP
jgi:pectinesterase